jgi:hypothetical protein
MKLEFTTSSTGDAMYAIVQRAYDGYWFNTVDDGFDPSDTTIDGSFDPYVDLTEYENYKYSSALDLPNGQYIMHLYEYRGTGDKDHTLDDEIPVSNALIDAIFVADDVDTEEPAYVRYGSFLEDSIETNEDDIATLDTNKLESSDVDTASIGRLITNCPSVQVPDGIITDYTFAGATGVIAGSEIVTIDGVQNIRGTDYTIAGDTVTFLPGHLPQVGEVVIMNCCITATWA